MEDKKLLIDIIKIKLLLFSAGFSGCWLYITNREVDLFYFGSVLFALFFSLGICFNLVKLTDIYNKISKDTK